MEFLHAKSELQLQLYYKDIWFFFSLAAAIFNSQLLKLGRHSHDCWIWHHPKLFLSAEKSWILFEQFLEQIKKKIAKYYVNHDILNWNNNILNSSMNTNKPHLHFMHGLQKKYDLFILKKDILIVSFCICELAINVYWW